MPEQTQTEWTYPEVHVGDTVEVCQTPTWTRPAIGTVTAANPRSCDILTMADGVPFLRFNCLHRDDPEVPHRPDVFSAGDSGVWDLCQGEKARRQQAVRLDLLEKTVAQLLKDVKESRAKAKPALETRGGMG